jgi:hypothetical protein
LRRPPQPPTTGRPALAAGRARRHRRGLGVHQGLGDLPVRVRHRAHPAHQGTGSEALVAAGHNALTVLYAVGSDRVPYRELGPEYLARKDPRRAPRRHVAQPERLGDRVALTPVVAA